MVKGFIFFHDACNNLRHLLIAAGCLQVELEPDGRQSGTSNGSLALDILHKMDALTREILASMERFTDELDRGDFDMKTFQYLSLTQDSAHRMIDAVVDTSQSCVKVCDMLFGDPLLSERFHASVARSHALRGRVRAFLVPTGMAHQPAAGVISTRSHP